MRNFRSARCGRLKVLRQFLARVGPRGAFGDHVGIEVRDVFGRRGVVVTFQHANANRIAYRIT